MLLGTVKDQHNACVGLTAKTADGQDFVFEAVIDTGFNAALTIPPELASVLELTPSSVGFADLADGTLVKYKICSVMLLWNGILQSVSAYILGNEPLLGMRLLAGHELRMQVVPNGLVEISKI